MDGGMSYLKEGDTIPRKWKAWFREDKEHSSKWRQEAREAFDFMAGRQWSEADKQKLRDELRPAVTFNRSSVIIDAISGNEIQNRQEIRYLPREQGDAIVNEMYSEAARWFDDESEAEFEDSEAFIDNLITGMGWTETRLDFDEDPDGMPVTERLDCLEMFWDAAARKSNLKDARRIWRVREIDPDEARMEFPGKTLSEIDAGDWVSQKDDSTHENDPEDVYDDEDEGSEIDALDHRRKVRVIHLQYWEYETYYRVADPFTKEIAELDEDKFKSLEKKLKPLGLGLKSARLRRKVYRQAIIGREILFHGEAACKTHFNWNCITGKFDRNRGYWYGVVRAMKDPQTWANKWMSQVLHIMNSNSSGGWFYESGSFADQRQAEMDMAKPNAMVETTAGALTSGKIQPKQNAGFPQGYQMLTEFAISAIRDVTGVNLELLGMREANQAGVLEYQRRQAGLTVLATMFDSLRRYRRGRGKVLLYYIHNYLSDGRLIRITGQDKQKYVPLVQQADVKYDIIIDDAPTSPNQKEIVWQSLTQILPGIKDMIPPQVLLQLLEYSPIPASIVEKIKQVVQAPNPQAQEQAKMQAQAAVLELQQKQADIQKTYSEIEENRAETQLDRAKVGADIVQKLATSAQQPMNGSGPVSTA